MLVVVVWGVARSWGEIVVALRRVDVATVLVATALAAVGTGLTMVGWRVLLADLGSTLHPAPAASVFFVGQLGKYLPGSVWTVVAQADMAARLGVPRRRTSVAGLVALGISVLTGVLVAVPAVPHLVRGSGTGLEVVLGIVAVALLGVCWPPLLNRVVAVGLRVLRREPLEHELSPRAVLVTVGCYAVGWVCFGLHTLVLARAVGLDGRGGVTAALTGYALAGVAGMVAIVLPAGLGAREGLLTLVLSPYLPAGGAVAVAILSRFVVTVVDVAVAGCGWAYGRRHRLLTGEHLVDLVTPQDVPPHAR
ncbi:MAG: flippase-like domain-containing protein [Actinomycetota bacterium]|nr:flippase-like domain-containing protein [Actinomycetota bacterium]